MSSEPSGMGRAARGLGAALLNATLLLTALVLALALALVIQMRGLAQDGREALRAEVAQLQAQLAETRAQASVALEALEARPMAGAAAGGTGELAGDLAGDLAPVREALTGLLDGLESRAATTPDTDPEMRALVFTFFRAIAERMFAEPLAP